jgi:hypothetical protein
MEEILLSNGWDNTALAAGTTASVYLTNNTAFYVELQRAAINPSDAVTANDTNYKTFTLKKASTDVVTPVPTTVAGGSMVAGTAVDLVISGTGKNLELAPGESFIFTATHTASGVAFRGNCSAVCRRIRTP